MSDETTETLPRAKRAYNRRPVREEVPAEPVRGAIRPRKQRLRPSGTDMLFVPPDAIPEGMDYQWVTDSVLQQPAVHVRSGFEMNGWEPVPAERHDGMFTPKGYKGEINVGGLVLMERPIELTMEARAEERQMAREAVRAQERKVRSGQVDGITLDTQHASARKVTRLTTEMERGMPIPKD